MHKIRLKVERFNNMLLKAIKINYIIKLEYVKES